MSGVCVCVCVCVCVWEGGAAKLTIPRVRRRWPCGDLSTSLAECYIKEGLCHAAKCLPLCTCQCQLLQRLLYVCMYVCMYVCVACAWWIDVAKKLVENMRSWGCVGVDIGCSDTCGHMSSLCWLTTDMLFLESKDHRKSTHSSFYYLWAWPRRVLTK